MQQKAVGKIKSVGGAASNSTALAGFDGQAGRQEGADRHGDVMRDRDEKWSLQRSCWSFTGHEKIQQSGKWVWKASSEGIYT